MSELVFDYDNVSSRRRGLLLSAAGVVLPGIGRVHADGLALAEQWRHANRAALAGRRPLWIALGDSLTVGVGAASRSGGWVGQLRERLPQRPDVVNLAVSGARVADLERDQLPVLEQLVATLPPQRQPALITVMIGSNDVLRPKYRRGIVGRFQSLLRRLPAGTVVTTLPNPTPAALLVNRAIASAARDRGLVVAELRDPRTRSWRGRLAADHFHPNERGYAALADVVQDAVQRRLRERGAAGAGDTVSP